VDVHAFNGKVATLSNKDNSKKIIISDIQTGETLGSKSSELIIESNTICLQSGDFNADSASKGDKVNWKSFANV